VVGQQSAQRGAAIGQHRPADLLPLLVATRWTAGAAKAPSEKPNRLTRSRSAQGCLSTQSKPAATWPGMVKTRR
jgi:hypothetical protein